MAYSLHKNGVITGTLNCFCLACDSFLETEHEARRHTKSPLHKTSLSAVQYCGKFEDEHVRKFKWGYYCQFCNVLLPIAAKMSLHVNEDEHKQNKHLHLLTQRGQDVVTFNNIRISEKAWHGLIDEICSLCNTEYDVEKEHKSNASHSLNLVLKPIQFGENNSIYRHLDESSVQCLTCNKLFVPGKMSEHFSGSEHLELYSNRRIETNGDSNKIECYETTHAEIGQINVEPEKNEKNKTQTSPKENSKIMEAIVKYQSQGININLETETAYCKKCSHVIPFEFQEIENHIQNHSSPKMTDSELQYPPNIDKNLNRVNINDKTINNGEDARDHLKNENQDDGTINSKNGEEFIQNHPSPKIHHFERLYSPAVDQNLNRGNTNDKTSDKPGDVGDAAKDGNQNDGTIKSKNEEKAKPVGSSSGQSEKNDVEMDPLTFAKQNHITYNEGNSGAYCRICGVNLPSPLKSLQEHVAGANHKKMAKTYVPVKIPFMVKRESKLYFTSVFHIENFFFKETVINEEICISLNSFCFISKTELGWRCLLCEENISSQPQVDAHVKTKQHSTKLEKAPVIVSEEPEFIREIRPGLYHCGYCHLVVSGWDDMKEHIKTDIHFGKRVSCERRMEYHYPTVHRHKMERDAEAMKMIWLLNRLHH